MICDLRRRVSTVASRWNSWASLTTGTRVDADGYPGAMAMTIKNERVAAKIRDLARQLDTDQVTAVERAIDALSEEVAHSVPERRLVEVLQLAQAIREALPSKAALSTEDLYDDQGLPR